MNISIEKGSVLTVGLEWVDCTASTIKPVIADFVSKNQGYGITLTNATGQSSVGSTSERGQYSAAAILAQYKHNCLCVLSDKDGWWIAACMDSLPASDTWLATESEAIAEAQALMAVMGDMDILGDSTFFEKAFPETTIISLSWEKLFSLADKSSLKKVKIAKFGGKTNFKQLLLVALLAPAIYWMYFTDSEPEIDPALSWEETHRNEVNSIYTLYSATIKNNPSQVITNYMDVIFKYRISIAGWSLGGVNCAEQQCSLKWTYSNGAGSYADFRQSVTNNEKEWGLVSSSQYSSDGQQILHSVSVPVDPLAGNISEIVTKETFYIDTLAIIQNAARSKLFSWVMGNANLSGRLTPSPDGKPLPSIEFNYGLLTLDGQGLFNVERTAEKLRTNQISINELNISMDALAKPTWSIKGNYVYR
jgi:hypothetical protein